MCGNVICGHFDPAKPFFTARGSFWTNSTTELLASTTAADRQTRMRSRCNGERYESVALIALSVGDERLGLLQLNDRRKGLFSSESISLWERLADYLTAALAKSLAEEELQKAKAEAERINRIKDEFLAVLSHELRTPLTAMLGWVGMLQSHDLNRSTMKKGLDVIERNVKTQTHLIEDLLDVSRIVAGKMKLEKEYLNLAIRPGRPWKVSGPLPNRRS